MPHSFPGSIFSFLPADIISQILNFGAPAPIDVQVAGPDKAADEAYAQEVQRRMGAIAGIADVRLQQSSHYPELKFNVNRTLADQEGVTERDVTNSLAINLTGSFQVAPAFWLNPRNGVSYPIVVQTPQYRTDTLNELDNLPITGSKPGSFALLGGLGTMVRDDGDGVVTHYAIQPSFDVYAATQGRDLGAVAGAIQAILKDHRQGRAERIGRHAARPSSDNERRVFRPYDRPAGRGGADLYLLLVINFQSWLDPFIIVTALPAALAGIVWMLFISGTTLSVPALTGAIMCMGGSHRQQRARGLILPRAPCRDGGCIPVRA